MAPKTAPKSTYEMPRARRSGGYMSPPRCPREVDDAVACADAEKSYDHHGRRVEVNAKTGEQVACDAGHEAGGKHRIRPCRSIALPPTQAEPAAAVRKIAGPSPSRPSTPVTSTNVIVATAAESEIPAPLTAMQPDRSSVFRSIGNCCEGGNAAPEAGLVTVASAIETSRPVSALELGTRSWNVRGRAARSSRPS